MQTLELGHVNAGFVLFILLILSTLLFGRFFCGWACHVMAYQDGASWILRRLGIEPKPIRSRLLFLVPFGAALYMFVWPSLTRMIKGHPFPALEAHFATESFWQTFPGPIVSIIIILVCGPILVYFLGSKAFCSYGCPYGAFFGAVDAVAPGRIRVNDACEQCGICTQVCTSNVRVSEEVAKFRAVVDTGCMKTLDCVSACPKEALSFGPAKPGLLQWSAIRKKKRRVYDFTWTEEIVLLAVFLVSGYCWRGLYEEVPFLLAVGLSILTAFAVLILWRFVRSRDFTFQRHVVRSAGRPTRAGLVLVPLLVAYVFLTGHSGFVQYHAKEGVRLLKKAEGTADPASRDELVDHSLEHLQLADRWGLVSAGGTHLQIGSILRSKGDLEGAENEMRKAIAADPSMRTPYFELASLLIRRGALEDAKPVLEELLRRDPENAQARDWLQRLEKDIEEKYTP